MEKIWIVKGTVSDDPDALAEYRKQKPDVKPGDVEWQFSDGQPGERGSSADFLTIEEGKAWAIEQYGEVAFIMVED